MEPSRRVENRLHPVERLHIHQRLPLPRAQPLALVDANTGIDGAAQHVPQHGPDDPVPPPPLHPCGVHVVADLPESVTREETGVGVTYPSRLRLVRGEHPQRTALTRHHATLIPERGRPDRRESFPRRLLRFTGDPAPHLLRLVPGDAALDPGREPALWSRQVDLAADGCEGEAVTVR